MLLPSTTTPECNKTSHTPYHGNYTIPPGTVTGGIAQSHSHEPHDWADHQGHIEGQESSGKGAECT